MKRRDFTTILLTRRLPDRPKQVESSYSKGDIKRMWGNEILKQTLDTGERQISCYEWLELVKE